MCSLHADLKTSLQVFAAANLLFCLISPIFPFPVLSDLIWSKKSQFVKDQEVSLGPENKPIVSSSLVELTVVWQDHRFFTLTDLTRKEGINPGPRIRETRL